MAKARSMVSVSERGGKVADPKKDAAVEEAGKPKKEKATLYFREDLLQEARTFVLARKNGIVGQEEPKTLSQLFNDALEHELERLRETYNRGERFQLHVAPLSGGRPKGS